MIRKMLVAAVVLAVVVPLVGCGEGGGPPLPPGQIDLAPALAAPTTSQPTAGEPDYVTRLNNLQNRAGRPQTVPELSDELAFWVTAVETHPDDAAAQLGLTLAILACAGQNASHAVGQDVFEDTSVAALTRAAVSDELSGSRIISEALSLAVSPHPPRMVDDFPAHALASFARYVTKVGHRGPLTVDLMADWARLATAGRRDRRRPGPSTRTPS